MDAAVALVVLARIFSTMSGVAANFFVAPVILPVSLLAP